MGNNSQLMETIEERCQRLLDLTIPSNSLDLFACFIFFILMHWIEKILGNYCSFFLSASLLLRFLWSYLLDKLCPKYITLLLSYLCIILCKFVLINSNSKIDFSLVTRNRGKIFFGMLACLLVTASFFLEPTVVNYYYLFKDGHIYPVETLQKNSNQSRQTADEVDIKEMKLTKYDQNTVMQRLGQYTKEEEDEINEDMIMGYQEFSAFFEELEPSLDEVKEAFFIFDQNRDGFVDARDLQIVLTNLGLGGDINLIKCQLMIEQYDRVGDGKISPKDFSKLLETSFS